MILRYKSFIELVKGRNTESDVSLETVSVEQIELARDELRRDIMLHQLEVRKVALMEKAVDIDIMNCEGALEDLEEGVQRTKDEIVELKQQLATERLIRSRREEYNALAKVANIQTVPRKQTEARLVDGRRKLEERRDKKQQTEHEMEIREKQFQLLMQSVFDLKSTLAEDAAKEADRQNRNDMHDNSNGGGVDMIM